MPRPKGHRRDRTAGLFYGFPVGLIECESNFLGIDNARKELTKAYCGRPFEIRYQDKGKRIISIPRDWIGDKDIRGIAQRTIALSCSDSTVKALEPKSLDGVFADPPYLGNVRGAFGPPNPETSHL